MHTASKVVREMAAGEEQEHGDGHGEVKPEDFYGFRSSEPDGNLRGSHPQFREEPPPGIHRARS